MRNFLLAALMLLSVCATAQVNNSFRGTLNVFSATGLAPNYRVTGFFSDANGYYSSDSCQVGDVIFAFYTTTCVRFVVDSIITKAGSIITADVVDVDSITATFPFGVTAIMRETATNGYPVNISGISGPLASCIETHFKGLIDVLQTGIGGSPGNSQDTIIQVAHGLSLLDPVHVDTSGLWIVSNVSSDDSLHMAVVTEVIAADTFIVTYSGITSQPAHGYDVGRLYYVQDNGSYGLTAPPGLINDLAFYAIDVNKLFITEQRPVAPMTDLNGIYSTSDTIPNGVGAYATDFRIHTDSVQVRWIGNEIVVTDNKATPTGVQYAASGYVTDPLSLTTKEYVDSTIAVSAHPAVTVTDGATIDFTLATQNITAEVRPESIQASHIDTGAVTSSEIQDGTITTADLAFTPLQGSGTSGQVAVYNGTNSLTSYATYTFNGTDNLTYYNTGLSQFTLGRFYLKYDSINTAQQLLIGSTSRILSLPRSNSSGMILYPAADNSTTTSALVLSTGRTNVTDNSVMAINTPQYIGSLAGTTYALNIDNTITQDNAIDVSNGIAGGINIQQTQPAPVDNVNQKTEYYGIRVAPSLTRNIGSSDNLYGLLLAPSLYGSSTQSAWRGIYNNTAHGFFIYDNAGANNYFAGRVTIAHTANTDYRLLVSRNSGTNPLSNFSHATALIQVKGSSVRSIRSDNTIYYTFPTIMTVAGPTSPHEITNLGTSSLSRAAILAGASPHSSSNSFCYAIVGHVGLQTSPTSGYLMEAAGIQGVSEYILNTASSGDENLKGAGVNLYAIRGDSKMSQNYTNGSINLTVLTPLPLK